MKALLRAVLVVALLPVFWIVGFVVANPFTAPAFHRVDPADPPVDLAVLGVWEDGEGELACRAFYHRDLDGLPDSLPLRFRVTDPELRACQAAFRDYGATGRWTREFDFDRRGFGAGVARPDPDDPTVLVVTYRSDMDRLADTRYSIDVETGRPTDFAFRGAFGPARGVGTLMFGGAGGTAAWLVLVAWLVVRRLRREPQAGALGLLLLVST